jgi:hypothetical protein
LTIVHFNQYFLWMRRWFSRPLKNFSLPYTLINLFFASLKLLTNFENASKPSSKFPSLIGQCSLVPTSHWLQVKCARNNLSQVASGRISQNRRWQFLPIAINFRFNPIEIPKSIKLKPSMYCIQGQGVTKRCRLSWLTNSALVYEPKCWEGGGGCGVSANDYRCAHGAQVNFGDLNPYSTYGCIFCTMYIPRHIRLFFAPNIVGYLEEGKFPEVMQQVSILADFLLTKIQTKRLDNSGHYSSGCRHWNSLLNLKFRSQKELGERRIFWLIK